MARGYTGPAPAAAQTSQITATFRTPCATATNKTGCVEYHGSTGRTIGLYRQMATTRPAGSSSLISDRNGCVFSMNGVTVI